MLEYDNTIERMSVVILSKYRKIRIRESPYFIIFQAVLNFICYGGHRNLFEISTSRFFPKTV